MRTSLQRKTRRLFLERLECRYALDGELSDPSSLIDNSPPPDPDPAPAEQSPSDPSSEAPPPSNDPPPDANCDGIPDDPAPEPSQDPPPDPTLGPQAPPTNPPADPPPPDPTNSDPPPDDPTDPNAPPSPSDETPPPTNPPPTNPPPTNPPPSGDIDPNTLPPGDATPDQIAALTPEEYAAWCMLHNYIDGGYLGYTTQNAPTVPIASNTGGQITQSAAQELTNLGAIFDQALYLYQSQAANSNNGTNQVLGLGWYGNISGAGPKCDQVFTGVSDAINQVMQQQFGSYEFNDYTFATIVAGGMFDFTGTGVSDHVYFGIVNKNTGQLEYFMDPWRNVMFFQMNPAAGDPNWNVNSVDPWTYVPPFVPTATQDPIQGSPPGDDGHWVIH
jgi:hypothetical protein